LLFVCCQFYFEIVVCKSKFLSSMHFYFIHLLLILQTCGVSIFNSEGGNFQDSFKHLERSFWRLDQGTRHCNGINCIYSTPQNLRIVSNAEQENPLRKDELLITMRNDCEEQKYCCRDASECTSYTSGQISSNQMFGYGSYSFMLQPTEQTEEFQIVSSAFKSVKCLSSPKPADFPYVMHQVPTRGYCVNHEADLVKYSSNRDLCQGVGKNICARFTWVVNTLGPTDFTFKANSMGWKCTKEFDYIKGADYHQMRFDVNVDSNDLIESCKNICLNREGCVAIAYQKHATEKICMFHVVVGDIVGLLENHSHGEGLVCTYGRRMIDYDTAAIYVNGKLVRSGGRPLMQEFDVSFQTTGRHTVEVYGHENCCAGAHKGGYTGWTMTRKGGKGNVHFTREKIETRSKANAGENPPEEGESSGQGGADDSVPSNSDEERRNDETTEELELTTTEAPTEENEADSSASGAIDLPPEQSDSSGTTNESTQTTGEVGNGVFVFSHSITLHDVESMEVDPVDSMPAPSSPESSGTANDSIQTTLEEADSSTGVASTNHPHETISHVVGDNVFTLFLGVETTNDQIHTTLEEADSTMDLDTTGNPVQTSVEGENGSMVVETAHDQTLATSEEADNSMDVDTTGHPVQTSVEDEVGSKVVKDVLNEILATLEEADSGIEVVDTTNGPIQAPLADEDTAMDVDTTNDPSSKLDSFKKSEAVKTVLNEIRSALEKAASGLNVVDTTNAPIQAPVADEDTAVDVDTTNDPIQTTLEDENSDEMEWYVDPLGEIDGEIVGKTEERVDVTTDEPEDTTTEQANPDAGEGQAANAGGSGQKTETIPEQKKPFPLIIDCDAGFDDTMGIVLTMSLASEGIYNLKGITISNGNTQGDHPWNAVHVIVHEVFNRPDIPIFRMRPRIDEMVDIPYYGIDGHYGQVVVYLHSWGGIEFPETPMNSQEFLCAQLLLEPNLVIMVTGPLTNLHACHHFIKPTHRIFMMGGAIEVPGNVPADYQAEFNFATDPNAVRDVIMHGNSVIIPLDCKMRFFTHRIRDALVAKENKFLLEVYNRFTQQVYKAVNGKETDMECDEECISIYDAVANYVMFLVLSNSPIQLASRHIDIDDRGAVIPGPHSVQYCGNNSFPSWGRLYQVRLKGTRQLIKAMQAAVKDFNEYIPSQSPTHWVDVGSFSGSHYEAPRQEDDSGAGPSAAERMEVGTGAGDDSNAPEVGHRADNDVENVPGLPTLSPTQAHVPTKAPYAPDYEMPRYDESQELDDRGAYGAFPEPHIRTTDEMTTSESTTSDPSSTESSQPVVGVDGGHASSCNLCALMLYGAQYCIALLRRVGTRFINNIATRISMCLNSANWWQASLAVRHGDQTWKETVKLPFEASGKIGTYKIDWLPNRIIWKVDDVSIGQVTHDFIEIPDSPMHIKAFIIPNHSVLDDVEDSSLIEHQLHLHSASYEKFSTDKTELFVLGENQNHPRILFLLLSILILITALVVWIWRCNGTNQTPSGYIALQGGDGDIRIL